MWSSSIKDRELSAFMQVAFLLIGQSFLQGTFTQALSATIFRTLPQHKIGSFRTDDGIGSHITYISK